MTPDHEPATPPLSRPAGLLARQRILALVHTGAVAAAAPIEPGPVPAGEPRPAARRRGLSRARELPAGARTRRCASASRASTHEIGIARRRRRGAGEGHASISRRCSSGSSSAASVSGAGQSEELDRPARHFHPPDHRPAPRPSTACAAGYRGPLCAEISPRSLPRPGAQGLAAEPAALPRTARRSSRPARFARSHDAEARSWSTRARSSTARSDSRVRVDLRRLAARRGIVGYRAIKSTPA